MTRARKLKTAAAAAWCLAAVALLAGLMLTVWFDRDGGVTLLLLRRTPAWAPLVDASVDWAKLGWLLIPGNENGVTGEDFVTWNTRVGVWAAAAGAGFFSWLAASCPADELAPFPARRALRRWLLASLLASVLALTLSAYGALSESLWHWPLLIAFMLALGQWVTRPSSDPRSQHVRGDPPDA